MKNCIENNGDASDYSQNHISGSSSQHKFGQMPAWSDPHFIVRHSRVDSLDVAGWLVAISCNGLLKNGRFLYSQESHGVVVYELDLVDVEGLLDCTVDRDTSVALPDVLWHDSSSAQS